MHTNYKKFFIITLFILSVILCLIPSSYAATQSEEQELLQLLNENKDILGDLNSLQQVMSKLYDDLQSANTVDESLKQTLKNDINMLDSVPNINPVISTVLKEELSSQVDNLTSENIDTMREEVGVIKEWCDEQIGYNDNNNENNNNNQNDNNANNNISNDTNNNINNNSNNTNQVNTQNSNKENQIIYNNTPSTSITQNTNSNTSSLPYTGKNELVTIIIILVLIFTIYSLIRIKQLKEV